MTVSDQWIADACAEAHRLRHLPEAALILRQVERQVLGCGACGAAVPLGRVYCSRPCRRRSGAIGAKRSRLERECSIAGCDRTYHSRRRCEHHIAVMRARAA